MARTKTEDPEAGTVVFEVHEDEPLPEPVQMTAREALVAVAEGQRVVVTRACFADMLEEDLSADERMELKQRERRTEIYVEDR